MAKRKKKYQYDKSERKFRVGTFFAGLANIVCGVGIIIGMAVVGFKIIPMDDAAGQLLWIFLIGSIPFLIFTAIGLVIGIPLIIFGAIDITHGFLPDRYYRGSVVFEIVITVISAVVAAVAIYLGNAAIVINPSVDSVLDSVIRLFGYVQLGICFLRVSSLLWFGIRSKSKKEQTPKVEPPQDLDAQKDTYIDPFDR